MQTVTSTTLLDGLKSPENAAAWDRYVNRYRPVLVGFARSLGVPEDEAEDVAQATLLEFSRAYCAGRYRKDRGRLRSWLFGIARNEIRAWTRRRRRSPRLADDEGLGLENVPESRDRLQELWDEEWRAAVLRECLHEVSREVGEATFEAFRRFAIDRRPARDVSIELGISENAVFLAKRRVLRRARELVPLMEDVW